MMKVTLAKPGLAGRHQSRDTQGGPPKVSTLLGLVLGIAWLASACGSGSGGVDSGGVTRYGPDGAAATTGGKSDAATGACVTALPAGASMSWLDNGTPECAYLIEATRETDPTQDFIEIIGSTSTGIGAGLTVASYSAPLGGTYDCKSPSLAVYYASFVYPGTLVDCSITIVSPGAPGGANAVGSFSATLTSTSGGTTTIASGSFNTPVMPTTGTTSQ